MRGSSSPLKIMTGTSLQVTKTARRHNKGLVLIAVYKLLLALIFITVGIGALHLVGKDIDDVLSTAAADLKFNPEGRFVNFLLDRASFLDDPMLRRIGFGAFCYAAIGILEGIGLYLEQAWAEYLTLIITASFLPLEAIEILHKLTLTKVALLVVNALVLLYLLKVVVDRRRYPKGSLAA